MSEHSHPGQQAKPQLGLQNAEDVRTPVYLSRTTMYSADILTYVECSNATTAVPLQDITPGKIAFTKPALSSEQTSEHTAVYKPADLQNKAIRLRVGDKVEFSLAQQQQTDDPGLQDAATGITLVSRAAIAAGEQDRQLKGCVISVKEGFGFIR